MTIFQLLKNDHRTVLGLFNEIEKTDQNEPADCLKLYQQAREELLVHIVAEEKAMYPRLIQEDETRSMGFEALEEHDLARHLMQQINDLDPQDERWTAKVTVLQEIVEHHIEDEEQEIFPKMKTTFKARDLEEMARDVEQIKSEQKRSRRRLQVRTARRRAA